MGILGGSGDIGYSGDAGGTKGLGRIKDTGVPDMSGVPGQGSTFTPCPANIYLFRVNNKIIKKGVKYVQR